MDLDLDLDLKIDVKLKVDCDCWTLAVLVCSFDCGNASSCSESIILVIVKPKGSDNK